MVNRNYTVDERVERTVLSLPTRGSLRWTGREMAQVDPSRIAAWADQLHETESEIRQMRAQLEGVASGRVCGYCGNKVGGRRDRKYCSGACRQMGHRARQSRLES